MGLILTSFLLIGLTLLGQVAMVIADQLSRPKRPVVKGRLFPLPPA